MKMKTFISLCLTDTTRYIFAKYSKLLVIACKYHDFETFIDTSNVIQDFVILLYHVDYLSSDEYVDIYFSFRSIHNRLFARYFKSN